MIARFKRRLATALLAANCIAAASGDVAFAQLETLDATGSPSLAETKPESQTPTCAKIPAIKSVLASQARGDSPLVAMEAGLVCPLYLIANYGTYSTYYAEICVGQYTVISGPNGLQPSSCDEPEVGDCIAASPLLSRTGFGTAGVCVESTLGERGLADYPQDPKLGDGVELVAEPRFVTFTKIGDGIPRKARAKLYLLRYTGTESEEYVGIGHEVPYDAADYVSSAEKLQPNCYSIRLGSISYQVLTVDPETGTEKVAKK